MSDNKKQFLASFSKYLDDLYGPLEETALCQSPIEAMLFQAISVVAGLRRTEVSISQQEKIANYRVDMLVKAIGLECQTCANVNFVSSVIVECDGHDFHERTKEQASRDKKRDRSLQHLGHHVFRFTGSDIWKDVFGCADEVMEFLDNQIEKQSIDHYYAMHRGEQ